MKLRTVKLGKKWWIVGDEEDGPYGPYDLRDRKEANEDRRGITAFFQNLDNHRFFTSDNSQKMKEEN